MTSWHVTDTPRRAACRASIAARCPVYTQRENNRTASQQRNNIADAIKRGAGDKKE